MNTQARTSGREMTGEWTNVRDRRGWRWVCGLVVACTLGLCVSAHADGLTYADVQACTNAYNHLWFSFESIKSSMRNADPGDVAVALRAEFVKVLDPNVHFALVNLPIPPDFNSTIDLTIDGIDNLAQVGAYGIDHFGEHHVAGPFSVKLASSAGAGKTYRMTTRDVSYTRDGTVEGGCTVYLAQKDVRCTVRNPRGGGNDRTALLDSIVNHGVTSYRLPAPQCGLWIEAPIPSYP